MSYRIMASNGNEGAVVEKKGKLYYSWGPRIKIPIIEKDLQRISKTRLQMLIERDKYILHTPPTEVSRLEDWPVAAIEYERRKKSF